MTKMWWLPGLFGRKHKGKKWPSWMMAWNMLPWNTPEMIMTMPNFRWRDIWNIIFTLFLLENDAIDEKYRELAEDMIALYLILMNPAQAYQFIVERFPSIQEKIKKFLGEEEGDVETSSVYEDILGGDADVRNPWIERRMTGVSLPDMPGSSSGGQ